ncbi:DUF6448 family protein [Paenibacillus durus]|uniref:Peptidoglycan-binding protein n=1 Tax=Paenibacillus durus ATCC 35681 TaxID=1333534 RepID=A0A0F7CGY2_PAEDU|nr:DUF6448 family protein [Paenibacillus durus]AKG33325.1 peptidoglycan-binding protein [Paenibacillus durus ATCC 35681]
MRKFKNSKIFAALLMALVIVAALPTVASAHCDTMDGPTVADGKKAMETNNVNYVLKWVQPEYEKEISQIFTLSMKVKDLSPEAKELSEKYFLENLVRVHRAGENAPFTGLKPSGTPIDEKVLAADKSIEAGNLSPLENLIEKDKMPELKERFEKVMALKNFDVNNVEAGREYIEAYVKLFKFAEGEEDHDAHGAEGNHAAVTAHAEESQEEAETLPVIPWSLAGVFSVTTLILGIAYQRKASK